jgi:hypothetical protein
MTMPDDSNPFLASAETLAKQRNEPSRERFAPAVKDAAAQHGLPEWLLSGVLAQESGFDPNAVGDNGASQGMGQFNKHGAAADYGMTPEEYRALPPEEQINKAAEFLSRKVKRAGGDPFAGARLYNGGGDPNYVQNVTARAREMGFTVVAPGVTIDMPERVKRPTKVDDNPFTVSALRLAQQQAAGNLRALQGTNPDSEAKAYDLAEKTGVPVSAVRGNEPMFMGYVNNEEALKHLSDAPVTAGFLSDAANASVSSDDVGALVNIEAMAKSVSNVGRAVVAAVPQTAGQSLRGFGEIYGAVGRSVSRPLLAGLEAVGMNDLATALQAPLPWYLAPSEILKKPGELIEGAGDAIGPKPEDQTIATMVGQGVGQVATQIAAAIVTGGGSAMAMMYGQGASQAADDIKQAGAETTPLSDAAIIGYGAITAITERYGLDILLNRIPAALKSRIVRILAGAGSEAAQEMVEQIMQNLTAMATFDPEQPLFEGVAQSGEVAGYVGAIVSAIIPGKQHAQRATQHKAAFDQVQKAAEEAKLTQRAPAAAAEHRTDVLRSAGVENVQIAAEKLSEFGQSEYGQQHDIIRSLGVSQTELDDAIVSGGNVTVPVDAFSTHVLGTEAYAPLADYVVYGDNGMTADEAKTWNETGFQEEIAALVKGMPDALAAGKDVLDQQETQIFDEARAQLIAAGVAPAVADHQAAALSKHYRVRGDRSEVQPIDLWKRDRVTILGPDQKSVAEPTTSEDLAAARAAAAREPTKEDLAMVRALRTGKPVPGGVKEPQRFASWTRENGGVKNTSGEISAILGKGSRGGLVNNKTGMTFDHWLERAVEDGWLQEGANWNDLQELLRRDTRGQAVYRPTDEDAYRYTSQQEALAGLDRLVTQAGIDLQNLDDAEAWKRIQAAAKGETFTQTLVELPADLRSVVAAAATKSENEGRQEWIWKQGDKYVATLGEKPEGGQYVGRVIGGGEDVFFQRGGNDAGLPMDEAARMARADAMGYTVDAYHGTNKDIREFILSKSGLGAGTKKEKAVFVDINPKNASDYAHVVGGESGVVYPLRVNPGKTYHSKLTRYTSDGVAKDIAAARKQGFDSVDFPNFRPEDFERSQIAILDPRNIRSRFANFDPAKADIADLLAQGQNRASIQFGPGQTFIRLGPEADFSSFLHETGHLFLENLRSDAFEFGKKGVVDDWDTIRSWWADNAPEIKAEAIKYAEQAGDKDAVVSLAALSDEQVAARVRQGITRPGAAANSIDKHLSRAMHEQWARGAEDYFRTGQAPSVALQGAFNRFRAWLVSIYAAIRRRTGKEQLDVMFPPKVRAVMDRLLASDEEINLVNEQYDIKALFDAAEQVGMTPAQFQAYQRLVARSADDTKTAQVKKHLAQIERQKLAWWKEERAKVEAAVTDEVHDLPVYRVLHAVAAGTSPDGTPLELKPGKLDRAAVVKILGDPKRLEQLPRVGRSSVYTTNKQESGSHPDVIAGLFGFPDGETMLLAMLNSQPMNERIQQQTDEQMRETFGDMLTDGTAAEEALKSTHTDTRGQVLHMELNALRQGKEAMKPAFVRQWAKERLDGKRVEEISPFSFTVAERKYGKEAGKLLRAGDRVGAARAKFRQLLNYEMAKQAYKVRDEVADDRAYLSKFNNARRKWGGVDADYVDKIKLILSAYGLGSRAADKAAVIAELRTLPEWQATEGEDGALIDIPAEIIGAGLKTNYRDLTLGEWRTLVDTIHNIHQQGKNKKSAEINGERVMLDDMSQEIVNGLDRLPDLARMKRKAEQQTPDFSDRVRAALAGFDANLRKVEFLAELIDGVRSGGPFHRYFYQVFADAQAAQSDLTVEISKEIMDGIAALPTRNRLSEKIKVDGLGGRVFRRSELITMALNVGNESNYKKMIKGSSLDVTAGSVTWTDEGVREALDHLTADELAFVQKVWDIFERHYPKIEAIYRKENGRSPERIVARETVLGAGVLRGGYYPMKYDPSRSGRAKEIEAKSALEAMQSAEVRASVYSGMTKERAAGFAAPVDLSLESLPGHIDKMAHYITHYEPVRLTRRLMSRPELLKALTNKIGPEKVEAIKSWLGVLATGRMPPPANKWDAMIGVAASRVTLATLGLSYTTGVMQTLGVFNSTDALSRMPGGGYNLAQGTRWMANGFAQYLKHPADTRRAVMAASGEMRHRIENTDRDVRQEILRAAGKKGGWAKFQKFSMMAIAGMQFYAVDIPTWVAAYQRAQHEGMAELEAVRFADHVVRTSQSAGGLKDLAEIQRSSGLQRAFTMYYSFFNVLYNQGAGAIHNTKSARDIPQLAARALILIVLPQIAEGFLRNQIPPLVPDDEDKQGFLAWLGLRILLYPLATIPGIRDFASVAQGFDYSPTPIMGIGKEFQRAWEGIARDIDEGQISASTLKAIFTTTGLAVGAPVTQINRIIRAADDFFAGEPVGPYDFLVGPPPKN